jgi:DNA-binding GntR family transcriptional regulator
MTWTVYTSLRDSILNGGLPPGQVLSQVQLASEYGVSRGPLREAVRMLQREGSRLFILHESGSRSP